MTIFVAILMTFLTFAFVAYPFFKERRYPAADLVDDDELHR